MLLLTEVQCLAQEHLSKASHQGPLLSPLAWLCVQLLLSGGTWKGIFKLSRLFMSFFFFSNKKRENKLLTCLLSTDDMSVGQDYKQSNPELRMKQGQSSLWSIPQTILICLLWFLSYWHRKYKLPNCWQQREKSTEYLHVFIIWCQASYQFAHAALLSHSILTFVM